jgi:nitrous oxidase accessory protein
LTVRGNQVRNSRYGLHFMYCDDTEIAGNVLRDNSVGAFLMYSRRLRFIGNAVAGNHGPSGYGIGLKDMDDFTVAGNRFLANRVAVFVDGAPAGGARLTGNLIGAGELGVRLLPNVRGLVASDNSFLENQQQVEIAGGGGDPAGNRWHGNHWSDYTGFDADGDGRGDVPYRAERLFEELLDRSPALRLFAFSPLVRAVDFASRAFPLVRPQPKLVDEAPRLLPPPAPAAPALAVGGGVSAARRLAVALLLLALALLALPRLLLPRSGARRRSPRALPGETMQRPVMLAVRGLGKRYGARAVLDDLTFTVRAGEAVALWGANGAGKTTALRALLGVIPCRGEVRVDGLDVRRQGRAARRLLGFVPQEIAFPDATVAEALALFAALRGVPGERIAAVCERMGLGDELDKRVHALSGGRKQRLALAIALLADPPLLLLDEASSNLDAAARRELLRLLAELKEEGKTLLFSSHRPEEVARLADRVLHLEHGRLVADLPPAELLAEELAEVNERLCAERAPHARGTAAGDASPTLGWSPALPASLGGAIHTHDFPTEDADARDRDV